jgi:hypothetical protein
MKLARDMPFFSAPGAMFTGGAPMSDAVVFAQWNAARRLLEHGARTTIWQAAAIGPLDRAANSVQACLNEYKTNTVRRLLISACISRRYAHSAVISKEPIANRNRMITALADHPAPATEESE